MPQIAENVLKVLDAGRFEGPRFFLVGDLDRKLYTDTNKVLEAAGGKWNRSAKAHVFDGDASDALEPIILTGEYRRVKQDFGQFDTPEDLAAEIVSMADVEPGMSVLEPNVGIGNIAVEIERAGGIVTGFDIDLDRVAKAHSRAPKGRYSNADFLSEFVEPVFDRVVMNPPFAKQADIHHVLHAHKFLKPEGKLVAIMSAGVMFRENALAGDFRSFVASHRGTIQRLPDESFKASGTSVNTCVVTMSAA